MNNKVLIVADNLDLRNLIQDQMEHEAMSTNCVATISEALGCIMEREYDLVVLDLQLSGINDIEMVRIIRVAKSVPVLALTEPLKNDEKIILFKAGMGAFMEKPIAADVCAAQAKALIRLNLPLEDDSKRRKVISIGASTSISPTYRQVLVDGRPLGLTKKEFDLLYYMVSHPYQVFSKVNKMILTKIQASELGLMMREHITCLLRMNAVQLDLNWTAEFSRGQIISCCDRMIKYLDCTLHFSKNVQRELLQNPQFAPWLARLRDLTKKPTVNTELEEPCFDWNYLAQRLEELLEVCWLREKMIIGYSEGDVLFVIGQFDLTADAQLTYLESVAPIELDDSTKVQIIKSLSVCKAVPIVLDNSRRALLTEPYVSTQYLFTSADFEDIWKLFQCCPTLAGIAHLLHEEKVSERLSLTDYQHFAEDGAEYLRLLTLTLQRLSTDAAGKFLHHWQENSCTLSELQRMERRTRTTDAEELDTTLVSYTGYINLLYGKRFKTISLDGLTKCQEKLLVYAIMHEKKHFIQLIDKNADKFLGLSQSSILFYEPLYHDYYNLNELTVRDLDDCGWMLLDRCQCLPLMDGQRYTFPELKLLYDAPKAYSILYSKLRTPRLDDRIKVLRQLRKRHILDKISNEEDLTALAEHLDQKPLANWWREDLGHIKDIQAEDVAQILIHLNKLSPSLPGFQYRADAMLALRSLEHLDRFDNLEALKANLMETDLDWKALADAMKLDSKFKMQHQEDIISFLCRNGAGIAQTYLKNLDIELHSAFYRGVKAELMGQFNDLKYHVGDLERELDYPLSIQAKAEWMHNLSVINGSTVIREQDDFFSTMLLGTQPYETCLSYRGGAYCNCLLACFDSNKKVLYAEQNGHVVARACVRLTKCCVGGDSIEHKEPVAKLRFVDLEAENDPQEERHKGEHLTLFLEHLYSSGLSLEAQLQIKALFVKLVQQKAGLLDALLVLSLDYQEVAKKDFARTKLHLYIPASKAGGQYLDSLGGNAEVSLEGSYKKNTFLVEAGKNWPEWINVMMHT